MKGKQSKMVTARQFAGLHGVPYTTVIFWLRKEVIPGAEKQEIPVGRQGFIWRIPEDAPLPELPRGPKPKPKKGTKRASAQPGQIAANGTEAADDQTDEATPAKPKRRVSNRTAAKKALKKMRAKTKGN